MTLEELLAEKEKLETSMKQIENAYQQMIGRRQLLDELIKKLKEKKEEPKS